MIKETREFYGIPQILLAGYLGITRSQLSMAELGRRALKASALLALVKLYKAIPSKPTGRNSKEIAGLRAIQKNKLEKIVLRKLKQHDHKLTSLQQTLANMKAEQLRSIEILESMKILRANAEPGDKGLMDIIESDAKKLFNNTGEDSQLELELRIQSIKAETAFLKKRSNV